MYDFTYHRPTSLADAAKSMAAASDPKLLAGGQTLLPTLKLRLAQPSDVIDLGAIPELKGINVSGSAVTIGATTRHAEVAASKDIAKAIRALAELAGMIGDPAVRNMGTIGGSLANSDPAADYPAALLALGGTVHTTKRKVAAEDWFKGMFLTALEDGEIITKIEFPVAKRAGYAKFRNPASRYAMVGVFVADTAAGIRVAVTGAGQFAFRQKEMEAALGKSFTAAALKDIKAPSAGLNSDIHGSAEYRAHLITVMAQRAVEAALA